MRWSGQGARRVQALAWVIRLSCALVLLTTEASTHPRFAAFIPPRPSGGVCITCHTHPEGGRRCRPDEPGYPQCLNDFGAQVRPLLRPLFDTNGDGRVTSVEVADAPEDLAQTNPIWDADLAGEDADGDGYRNGYELGDPEGVWSHGDPLPGIAPPQLLPGRWDSDLNECALGLAHCPFGQRCEDRLIPPRPSFDCVDPPDPSDEYPFDVPVDSFRQPGRLVDGQWMDVRLDEALPTFLSAYCGGNGPDLWFRLPQDCKQGTLRIEREPASCEGEAECRLGLGVFSGPTREFPGDVVACRAASESDVLEVPVPEFEQLLRVVASGVPASWGQTTRHQGRIRVTCEPEPVAAAPVMNDQQHPTCNSAGTLSAESLDFELLRSEGIAGRSPHPDDACTIAAGHDLWLRKRATCTGRTTVRVTSRQSPICIDGACHCPPGPRHRVAIYQGDACASQLEPDACSNVGHCDPEEPAEATIVAAEGDELVLRVGGVWADLNVLGRLEVSCEPASCQELPRGSLCDVSWGECAPSGETSVCRCREGTGDGRRRDQGGPGCSFEPACSERGLDCGAGECVHSPSSYFCRCAPGYYRDPPGGCIQGPRYRCATTIAGTIACIYNRPPVDYFSGTDWNLYCSAGYSRTDGDDGDCFPQCGDGRKHRTEACDDGNSANGDGCSRACALEPGFTCRNDDGVHGVTRCLRFCVTGPVPLQEECPPVPRPPESCIREIPRPRDTLGFLGALITLATIGFATRRAVRRGRG